MLKKIILLAFLFGSSSLSFAKVPDSTLTVAPYNVDMWGYMGATVVVNHGPPLGVGTGITMRVPLNSDISLTVYAMNTKPSLASSCQNIQVREEGAHQLLFELKEDWLIHCRYIK